jgi:GntR family transcriptional regulator
MIRFELDFRSPLPLHEQIRRELRFLIFSGALGEGERLPPIRQLAVSLNVNPNTVARVYRDLEREGILTTRQGRGSFISPAARSSLQHERDAEIRRETERLLERARQLGFDHRHIIRLLEEIDTEPAPDGKEKKK